MKALALVKRNKLLVGMLVLFLAFLIPTIVLAAVGGNTWIGMSGVVHSNLYIGTGVHGQWWVGFNVPAPYINPSSPVGGILGVIPTVFISLAVLLLIIVGLKEDLNIKTIIILAVIIYMALAFLSGINLDIRNILGGIIR